MTQATAPEIDEAYRRALADLRQRVAVVAANMFRNEVDQNDIADSFAAFAEAVVPLITAGQLTAQELAIAYVSNVAAQAEAADDEDEERFSPLEPAVELAGVNTRGMMMFDALSAIGPMILDKIDGGMDPEDAMAFGESLVSRTADNETRAAADAEAERQAEAADMINNWEGVVQPDSCIPCQANAGVHPLTDVIYRHPNCNCEQTFVFDTRRVPGQEVDRLALELHDEAVRVEKQVTHELDEIAKFFDGNLNASFTMPDGSVRHTLDARLKKLPSLTRKIIGDLSQPGASLELVRESLYDNLRYTIVFDPDDLVAGVKNVSAALAAKGYTGVRMRNFWAMSDEGYAGYNSVWRTISGAEFELQFHTQAGLELKESLSHPILEALRTVIAGSDEAKLLNDQLDLLWRLARNNPPEGVLDDWSDWVPNYFVHAEPNITKLGLVEAVIRSEAAFGATHWSPSDITSLSFVDSLYSSSGRIPGLKPNSGDVIADAVLDRQTIIYRGPDGGVAAMVTISHGHIAGVYVFETYRGQGLGYAMYDWIQDKTTINLFDLIGTSNDFTAAGKKFALGWLEHRTAMQVVKPAADQLELFPKIVEAISRVNRSPTLSETPTAPPWVPTTGTAEEVVHLAGDFDVDTYAVYGSSGKLAATVNFNPFDLIVAPDVEERIVGILLDFVESRVGLIDLILQPGWIDDFPLTPRARGFLLRWLEEYAAGQVEQRLAS